MRGCRRHSSPLMKNISRRRRKSISYHRMIVVSSYLRRPKRTCTETTFKVYRHTHAYCIYIQIRVYTHIEKQCVCVCAWMREKERWLSAGEIYRKKCNRRRGAVRGFGVRVPDNHLLRRSNKTTTTTTTYAHTR